MTDLVSVSDRRAALAKQYSDPPAQVSARMPEIRLSVHMSKKAVPKGHFFIVDRNVPDGSEPMITDIGPSFQCIVLRSCMKLAAFDSDNNRSLGETSEFSDFQNEPIFVIDNSGERPCIATVARYREIKEMKYEPTKEEIKAYRDSGGISGKTHHPLYPILKDLKLQYIAYVLYTPPGATGAGIYSMKIGARGWLGMDKNNDTCRYGDEAETSFIKARSFCHKAYPRTTHMHEWDVFSSSFSTGEKEKNEKGEEKEIVDYYPSFKIKGEWGDDMLVPVEEGRELLKEFLFGMYGRRISFAWRNTTDREFIPRRASEMLDSSDGSEQVAAMLLGDRRLAEAAQSQLTVSKALPPPATSEHKTVSPKASVNAAVEEFGGETEKEDIEDKKPSIKTLAKKRQTMIPAERSSEDAAIAADRNVKAVTAKAQTTDPNAPGYYPAAFDEGLEPKKDTPVNQIPAGW